MKSFLWIGAVVLVIVGLMFWGRNASSIEPPFQAGILHPLDNIKGNASSSVVIMEYSDFQCPACKTYYPVMRELMQEYGDRAAFVYRHFPLTSIHYNAEFAARAAEAAKRQGKFWEMHDLLFEKQSEWEREADVETLFMNYAALLGISTDQFKTDWRSKEVKNFVSAQRVHALSSGLQGTPTFFIDGNKIPSPGSVQEFKTIINNALSN